MKPTKATPLAALALTMALAACTPQLETDGILATAPPTVATDLGAKPAYTATTRTNPETGQWQVGDKVTVTLNFYNHQGTPDGTTTQTLTCTAPAQWSANPPIIIAPGGATHVNATYTYTSAPDARTATTERITGTTPNSAEGQSPVIASGKVPLPPTGTLVLPTPTWQRLTALVVVDNIPAGSTAQINYTHSSGSSTAQWQNNTATPATAHFHLPADAPDAPAAPVASFSLQIDAQPATYTDVPYKAGQKYTLYANPKEPGTEGDNVQYTWIDPATSAADMTTMFNNPQGITRFAISGTGTGNVLAALTETNFVNSGKKIDLLMPDVTAVGVTAFYECKSLASISLPAATSIGLKAFEGCTSLASISLPAATSIGHYAFDGCTSLASISLPAATSIGTNAFASCTSLTSIILPAAITIGEYAFASCTFLTSISLPAAISIGNNAFEGCTSLASISLPATTSIGGYAFKNCTSLTRLELTAAAEIIMNIDVFDGIDTVTNLTLVLHSSAQNANNAMGITIKTEEGKRNVTFSASGTIIIPFFSVKDPAGNELKDTAPAPIAMNNPKLRFGGFVIRRS